MDKAGLMGAGMADLTIEGPAVYLGQKCTTVVRMLASPVREEANNTPRRWQPLFGTAETPVVSATWSALPRMHIQRRKQVAKCVPQGGCD